MKNLKMIWYIVVMISTVQLVGQNSFKVEVYGKGEPLLLFPGFSSTADVYQEIITNFSKDYPIIEPRSYDYVSLGEKAHHRFEI